MAERYPSKDSQPKPSSSPSSSSSVQPSSYNARYSNLLAMETSGGKALPPLPKQPSVEEKAHFCPSTVTSSSGTSLSMQSTLAGDLGIEKRDFSTAHEASDSDLDSKSKPSKKSVPYATQESACEKPKSSDSEQGSLPLGRQESHRGGGGGGGGGDDDDDEDISIKPTEYPNHLTEKQFDILLIYCEDDKDAALKLKDILLKFIRLEDKTVPSICVLDRNDNLRWINSKFDHLEEALKRSTYTFLFITDIFCKDAWAALQKDEVLMESIRNPEKKWCVVPIHTMSRSKTSSKRAYQVPFGLRSLKGIDISQMLKKHHSGLEDVDVDQLKAEDLDKYFLLNTTRMLDARHHMKLERQRVQKKDLRKWLENEKHFRILKRAREREEERMGQLKRERERELMQQELMRQREENERLINKLSPPSVEFEPPTPTVIPPVKAPTPHVQTNGLQIAKQLAESVLSEQNHLAPDAFLKLCKDSLNQWQSEYSPNTLKEVLLSLQSHMAPMRFEELFLSAAQIYLPPMTVRNLLTDLQQRMAPAAYQNLQEKVTAPQTPKAQSEVHHHYHLPGLPDGPVHQSITVTNQGSMKGVAIGSGNRQTIQAGVDPDSPSDGPEDVDQPVVVSGDEDDKDDEKEKEQLQQQQQQQQREKEEELLKSDPPGKYTPPISTSKIRELVMPQSYKKPQKEAVKPLMSAEPAKGSSRKTDQRRDPVENMESIRPGPQEPNQTPEVDQVVSVSEDKSFPRQSDRDTPQKVAIVQPTVRPVSRPMGREPMGRELRQHFPDHEVPLKDRLFSGASAPPAGAAPAVVGGAAPPSTVAPSAAAPSAAVPPAVAPPAAPPAAAPPAAPATATSHPLVQEQSPESDDEDDEDEMELLKAKPSPTESDESQSASRQPNSSSSNNSSSTTDVASEFGIQVRTGIRCFDLERNDTSHHCPAGASDNSSHGNLEPLQAAEGGCSNEGGHSNEGVTNSDNEHSQDFDCSGGDPNNQDDQGGRGIENVEERETVPQLPFSGLPVMMAGQLSAHTQLQPHLQAGLHRDIGDDRSRTVPHGDEVDMSRPTPECRPGSEPHPSAATTLAFPATDSDTQ